MALMDSRGHMSTSRAFDEDQMPGVTRRFFFTRDMEKFEHSIFHRMDTI